MEEKDKIGDLYKNYFRDYEGTAFEDDWLELELELNKSSFFKFSLSQFNIYYAFLIVSTFLLTSFIAVDYFYLHSTPTNVPETVKVNEEKLSIGIQNRQSKEFQPSNRKNAIPKPPLYKSKKEQIEPALKKEDTTIESKKDSTLLYKSLDLDTLPLATPADFIKKDSVKKQKKTIYIIKQDTLIKYDTLKIKKKREGKREKQK